MKSAYILSAAVVVLAAFFASRNPDGLEHVAGILGFAEKSQGHWALLSGIAAPVSDSDRVSSIVLGIAGTFTSGGIFLLCRALAKKSLR